ncbi:MAG: alpha-amylase [Marinobacter sp.]|uniref:alpha-amylase n=1 Tax=Marinobacter sp. TaxID=50741 RepID=UPI003C5B0636
MNLWSETVRPALAAVTCLSLAACGNAQTLASAAPSATAGNANDSEICQAATRELSVPVSDVFTEGEWVQDFYSGKRAQVKDGRVALTPAPASEGLLLLEPARPLEHSANTPKGNFQWAGTTVYFAVTDRFANGRRDNDRQYGRHRDGENNIGTFHGGDFAGLTDKLDYLAALGVGALWITPPFEQIHGWVGGGNSGDFKHYGYHGYYTLDFTRPDANFGTREEFRQLVEQAHARGIRVVMDVVMNHPGYSTLADMQTFGFGALNDGFAQYLPSQWGDWQPESWENHHAYHAFINYDHEHWSRWWGKDWVRAGIADYDTPPNAAVDPVRGSLAFLPDFRTESTRPVELPYFLRHKPDTRAVPLENATVRDYLIRWLTDWVREFGVDGFRVDTAKHVEPAAWRALKTEAQQALDDYRRNNPGTALPSDRFWMVAEVFPHSVTRSRYFDTGFDAVINFDFQEEALAGARCLPDMDRLYERYADALHGEDPFNVMSYISSHDTDLFSRISGNNATLQKRAAAALLFTPGTVQIFYGDESGRSFGPTGSDPHQGTRSAMNWDELNSPENRALLAHWRTLGQFRRKHPAIGAGQHTWLSDRPYTFARQLGDDRVVIAFGQKSRRAP